MQTYGADDALEIMEAFMDIEVEGPPEYMGDPGEMISCTVASKAVFAAGHSALIWYARAEYKDGRGWTLATSTHKRALTMALDAEGITYSMG